MPHVTATKQFFSDSEVKTQTNKQKPQTFRITSSLESTPPEQVREKQNKKGEVEKRRRKKEEEKGRGRKEWGRNEELQRGRQRRRRGKKTTSE